MNKLDFSFPRFSLALAAIVGSASATAQQLPAGLPAQANLPAARAAMSACNGDVQKFCPMVQPGGGRIVRCLAANEDKISQSCRDGMLKARAALGK